jgi:hypothetical protein
VNGQERTASTVREPGQRIGTARFRALEHLVAARQLVDALRILRSQAPAAAAAALAQLAKAARALAEDAER